MAATIKKIAELAGVSIGTVDRVINNRGRVSPAVEARVRSIIQEIGYTPNLMAKSLSLKRRSPKIGVIFHLERSGFLDEVEADYRSLYTENNELVEKLKVCLAKIEDYKKKEEEYNSKSFFYRLTHKF